MPRTIEKVRDELRKHTEKYQEAVARGDEFAMGWNAALVAALDTELDRMRRAERDIAEQSEAQYQAACDEAAAWDFGDSLEANQHECPSKGVYLSCR